MVPISHRAHITQCVENLKWPTKFPSKEKRVVFNYDYDLIVSNFEKFSSIKKGDTGLVFYVDKILDKFLWDGASKITNMHNFGGLEIAFFFMRHYKNKIIQLEFKF